MTVPPSLPRRYHVADCIVEPSANRIIGPDGPCRLEPKVMSVLEYLMTHPGVTVSAAVLLDAVWPDTIVEDGAIRRAISQLRKAFGDDARRPRVIETIPRKGYRLVADVVEQPLPHPGTRQLPTLQANVWRLGLLGFLIVGGFGGLLLGLRSTGKTSAPPPHRTIVTAQPGIEHSAALSPDGRRLAYLHDDTSATNAYVQALDGTPPYLLMDRVAGLAWSPEGTRLALLRFTHEGCTLSEIAATGGSETVLASGLTCFAPAVAWAPDGRTFALSALVTPEAAHGIVLLDSATGALTAFSTPGSASDTHPSFAPDGEKLAFLRHSPDGWISLVVRDVHGSSERELLREGAHITDFAWSPDSRTLLFASNRGGNYRLWSIPVEGGTPTWLDRLGAYDPSSPTVSSSGHRLVYAEWDFDFNVWSLSPHADATEAAPWLRSSRWDLHPRFSPDGTRLAFTSNRGGSHELWIADADGANPRPMTALGSGFVGHMRWSPDGQHLAFEVRREATASIHLLDVATGMLRALTDDTTHDIAPGWSADGGWVYFGSYRTDAWQLWKIPFEGGAAVPVTEDGGYTGTESSDGQWLYYVQPHRNGLWRRPVQGGPAERLPVDLDWGDWGSWEQRGEGLYLIERPARSLPVFTRLDLVTGQRLRLGQAVQPIARYKPSLTVHPDGTRLLYTQTDRAESDLVLLEPEDSMSLW